MFEEYTEGRLGSRFVLGHQLTKSWALSAGVRIENVNVSDVSPHAPEDYREVVGDNFMFAPRVGATYDTRDSLLRPTEGGLLDMSYEQALGSYNFPILNLEASRFFTTYQRPDGSGKHVIAVNSQIGYAPGAPVYERFFAGGFRSLRGFEFRGVGPSQNGFMTGGEFLFTNSIEYQVPILANDQLYAVGFIDSGTVERDFGITNYRVSAGVGLRVTVPALGPVPIALDFGFPINRTGSDREQVFAFWFGMYR